MQADTKNGLDRLENLVAAINERLISLRDLVDERDARYLERYNSQQTAVTSAFVASKELSNQVALASTKAVDKAEAAQAGKNDMQNEFRGQLKDQADTLMSKAEFDAQHKALIDRVSVNDGRISILEKGGMKFEGKSEGQAKSFLILGLLSAAAVGWIGLLIALAGLILRSKG